jgi:hypothetical protein
MKLINLLVSKLAAYEGKPVHINPWIQCFAFDIMGDLGFNKTYGSLESGKLHSAIKSMNDYLSANMILGQLAWFTRTLSKFPFLPNPMAAFEKFSAESIDERKKV